MPSVSRSRTRHCARALLVLAFGALLASPAARAVPPLPSSFWGEVTLDGAPVPAGTLVEALVDGRVCGRTRTILYEGRAHYALNALGDDPSTPEVEGGRDGEALDLAVEGVPIATGTWRSGTNVRVDLPAVTVALAASAYVVDEGSAGLSVPVHLGAAAPHEVRVGYETLPGSATEADVGLVAGTLILRPGETTRRVTIAITDDALDEPDEDFTFRLLWATGALLREPTAATVLLRDDDPPPVVDFEHDRYVESAGAPWVEVGVVLSAPSARTVRVDCETVDGTARAGVDYFTWRGTLSFPPGVTRRVVRVELVGGTFEEAARALTLALANPQNASLGPNSPAGIVLLGDVWEPRGARVWVPLVRRG